MTGHEKIRLMLYDYLRGELDEREKQLVEEHLGGCGRCSREAEELRGLLKVFPPPTVRPSDALPDSYWHEFVAGVERRKTTIGASGIRMPARIYNAVRDAFTFRRPLAIGGLAASAVAAVVAVLWVAGVLGPADRPEFTRLGGAAQESGTVNHPVPEGTFTAESDSVTEFDRRVADYFRRSKTLLVGVSNAPPGDEGVHDLDAERSASRKLVHEARVLRDGPVDERSWRLMEDLDEIMIELANMDERTGPAAAVMLRDGIKSRNLLFKLRMRETRSAATPVRQAIYTK